MEQIFILMRDAKASNMKQDLYSILGVAQDASNETIESAFRGKHQAVSKEVEEGEPGAESRLRLLIMAHDMLGNPAKRKAYEKIRQREAAILDEPKLDQSTNDSQHEDDKLEQPANRTTKLLDKVKAVFQGRVRVTRVLIFGVLLPFFIFPFVMPRLVFGVVTALWFLVVSYVLFRSASTTKRRIFRWAVYSLAGLMFVWNALSLLSYALVRQVGVPTSVAAAQQEEDPGCQSVSNALMSVLAIGNASSVQQETEFLKTPEGRFLDAAYQGRIDEARALLDQGVNINTQDKRKRVYGNNAMHHAARTNNVELAEFLLGRGMSVDEPGPTGYSALHVASGLGKLKMVRFLIGHGANVAQFDQGTRTTPIGIAIIQGRAKTTDLLLKSDAIKKTGGGEESPLMAITRADSICSSHAQIVRAFIDTGADLNEKDQKGYPMFLSLAMLSDEIASVIIKNAKGIDWTTPFLDKRVAGAIPKPPIVFLACGRSGEKATRYLLAESPDHQKIKMAASGPWGNPLNCAPDRKASLDLFRFLLDGGFDPNAKDENGKTPLHNHYNSDVLSLLLSRGANVNARDNEGMTPLHYAQFKDQVEPLITHGADVNIADKTGRTPLFGDKYGHIEPGKTRLLLAHGARVDVRDETGKTPLIFRLSIKNGNVMREDLNDYVNKGAELLTQDDVGATVFHYSAANGQNEIVSALLDLKPSASKLTDFSGRTPLHYAASNGFEGVADLLIKNGADLNAQDKDGNTPLHLGAMEGNKAFVEEVMKLGAKPTIKNKSGQRAADIISDDKPWASWLRQNLVGV